MVRENREDKKINKKKKKICSDLRACEIDVKNFEMPNVNVEAQEISEGIKKSKKLRKVKAKSSKLRRDEINEDSAPQVSEVEDMICNKKEVESEPAVDESQKSRKKKRKKVKSVNDVNGVNQKPDASARQDDNLMVEKGEDSEDEVYEMSSGDEDFSKGMKKWIIQYHQSRPGVKVLQDRIDDFIMAHEAQEEKARAEREAQAAEGGWTVVMHHKGRKKTTDAESGVVVGSVAQAAVLDKLAKKKKKEVGLDFYRFSKREAHMNEVMMLQNKFEQDKKRIQQMRAARKFRPY